MTTKEMSDKVAKAAKILRDANIPFVLVAGDEVDDKHCPDISFLESDGSYIDNIINLHTMCKQHGQLAMMVKHVAKNLEENNER